MRVYIIIWQCTTAERLYPLCWFRKGIFDISTFPHFPKKTLLKKGSPISYCKRECLIPSGVYVPPSLSLAFIFSRLPNRTLRLPSSKFRVFCPSRARIGNASPHFWRRCRPKTLRNPNNQKLLNPPIRLWKMKKMAAQPLTARALVLGLSTYPVKAWISDRGGEFWRRHIACCICASCRLIFNAYC